MRIDNWGGEIAEIGAIYPTSNEFILVLVTFVLWVAWFFLQARQESREYDEEMQLVADE